MKQDTLIKLFIFINIISSIGIPCLGNYIDKISIFYFTISIFSFMAILLFRKKIVIKGFYKYILLYYILLIIPTLINKGDIYLLICEVVITSTTILIWQSFNKDEFYRYLPVLVFALELLTYLNLFIILISPEGLYNQGFIRKYFLFGHVNIAFRYLLPGCCFNLIRTYVYKHKVDKRCIIYLIGVALTLIITWPVTAIVGIVIFALCIIISHKSNKIQNIISPINSMIISAFSSFMIIAVKIQEIFANLINSVLRKDITFSGRVDIWNTTIKYIKDSFLYGYGRLSTTARTDYLGATSAHNQFLIFLFEGGILLMSFIVFVFIVISKRMRKCNNKIIKSIIVSTIASYAVMWIAEPFSYSGTLLMFIIWMFAYYSEYLFNEYEKLQESVEEA